MFATWYPIEDPESGIVNLSWCVGRNRNVCDLKAPETIDILETKISANVKTLMDLGSVYYITLSATNGAGLVTMMSSNGVVIDYTPPVPGVVIDCNDHHGGDIDFVTKDQTLYASWNSFEDKESAVKFYEFSLCESQNLTNCPFPFKNIKMDTKISVTG